MSRRGLLSASTAAMGAGALVAVVAGAFGLGLGVAIAGLVVLGLGAMVATALLVGSMIADQQPELDPGAEQDSGGQLLVGHGEGLGGPGGRMPVQLDRDQAEALARELDEAAARVRAWPPVLDELVVDDELVRLLHLPDDEVPRRFPRERRFAIRWTP